MLALGLNMARFGQNLAFLGHAIARLQKLPYLSCERTYTLNQKLHKSN
jgi:hypothetical protein